MDINNDRLRREGYEPVKRDLKKTEILRHETRETDQDVVRERAKRKKKRKKPIDEQPSLFGVSMETVCLAALTLIIIVLFVSAIRHVELTQLSIPAMAITTIIVIIMGFMLGSAPTFLSMILVAAILFVGMLTGMLSEVMVGVIIFMGTVMVIKEKNIYS